MEKISASIIISFYSGDKTISKIISDVLKQKHKNKEVIVIWDNPNKKGLLKEISKKFGKKIKLLENKKNIGFAASVNRGIRNSKGEVIVTLVDDCIPQSDKWLSNLIKHFSDEKVVVVGSKIYESPPEVWEPLPKIGKELYWNTKGLTSKKISKRIKKGILDEQSSAYRKSALEKVGLFDSVHFKTAGEDIDMNIKIASLGKIIPQVESYVTHIHPLNEEDIYKKWVQYARSFGVLFRIHRFKLKQVKGGLIRLLFPFWAIGKILQGKKTDIKRKDLALFYLKLNLLYIPSFLGGYVKKRC